MEGSTTTSPPAAAAVVVAEDPATWEKAIAWLKSEKIDFQQKEHPPALTSQQSAEFRGSRLSQGAKAMLLRVKGEFFLVVLSAAYKLDLKAMKTVLNTKNLSFATEDEVRTVTGCVPGGVPPFGSLWKIKTYMDVSLRKETEIDFNCGLRTRSVHMKQADYERIEKPIVVQVAVEQEEKKN